MLLSVLTLGLLVIVVTRGPYSADMLVNLNPPTTALALLGVAQFFALCAIKPSLDRWWDAVAGIGDDVTEGGVSGRGVTGRVAVGHGAMRDRSIARVGSTVSAGSMTLYLWHMPVVLALAAAMWAVDLPLPAPHSGAWWLTRIPWLVALALALGGAYAVRVALTRAWKTAASRVTLWRRPDRRTSIRRTSIRRRAFGWRLIGRWAIGRWAIGRPSTVCESPSRRKSPRKKPPHGSTGAGQAVSFVLAVVVGVLIVLFCLGDVVPSTLLSSALLTLSVWPAWRRR